MSLPREKRRPGHDYMLSLCNPARLTDARRGGPQRVNPRDVAPQAAGAVALGALRPPVPGPAPASALMRCPGAWRPARAV
jgi:hypothetical protein